MVVWQMRMMVLRVYSSSSETKEVRKPPMQEIMLGKLAYKLSSTLYIQDAVRTVLRMLVTDKLSLADNLNVSPAHVRTILLKLDALRSLSRRFVAPPGGLLRIARYISPDSSPQANYDYFCATEELLLYRSNELPRDADGNVTAFQGFEHQRRSMLCTTIARGEGSTAAKSKPDGAYDCRCVWSVALRKVSRQSSGILERSRHGARRCVRSGS